MYRLRKRVKIILWVVVFAFIAWIFLELGADIVGKQFKKPWEQGIVAEIDGRPILYQTYNDIFNQMYQDSVKAKGGRDLTDRELAGIEQAAWTKLIEQTRWSEILKDRKIHLSDDAVLTLIQIAPPKELIESDEFKDSLGNFDFNKYRQAIANPQNLQFFVNYEKRIRKDVPIQLAQSDLILGPSISMTEAKEKYRFDNTKVKLFYVKVSPSLVPDSLVPYTDEDLKEYYSEHQDRYTQKERINLQYVVFPKTPSKEDTLSAKDRIESALNELTEGGTWDEVTKYYSDDDITRDKGGYLGMIPLDRVPPEFKSVIDTIPLNKVSAPVLSSKGWELIKVESKKKDSVEVRHILVMIRTGSDTKDRVRRKAEEFYRMAQEIGFDSASKYFKVEAKETRPFPRDLPFIPTLGRIESLLEFAKKAKQGELAPIIRRPLEYIVVYVKEVIPEHVTPFDDAKQGVEMDFKRNRKSEIADSVAKEIYERWVGGEDVYKLKDEYGIFVSVSDTYNVKLSQVIPGIPIKTPPYSAIYVSDPGEILPPESAGRNIYIIKLLEKEVPKDEEIEKGAKQILMASQQRIIMNLWRDWQQELAIPKEIKDYRNYLIY